MMSARTSFLVWWGLPILCAGFGAGVAAFAGEGGAFGRGPGQIGPLMLVAGYFAAVAFLALVFRLRQNQVALGDDRDRYGKPIEAAMVAACAPVLALGIWVFAGGFLTSFDATHTINGRLARVESIGGLGHRYAISLSQAGAPIMMECRWRANCGSPVPLRSLKSGSAVQIETLDGAAVGLKADGRQLVDPGAQRWTRLLVGGAALALLIVYSAAFVGASLRLLLNAEEADEGAGYWASR